MAAFFLSGFCAISAGVIVSLLRDRYQFNYSFSGTLVSAMSIGNVVALLVSGILPGMIGERATTLTLTTGYFIGYLISALTGNPIFLALAFLMAGIAKGCTAGKCTILVGSNSTLALTLSNGSSFEGSVSGEISNSKGAVVSTEVGTVSVTLDSSSTWTLTADTYITSFEGDPSCVIGNGYTLYVGGTALEGIR